jgi:hypothetical protein
VQGFRGGGVGMGVGYQKNSCAALQMVDFLLGIIKLNQYLLSDL